jgi:hypothetical protein
MRLIIIVLLLALVLFLTALTQVGGLVFLISMLSFRLIDKRFSNQWTRLATKMLSFATLYLLFVFVLVPVSARPFGRVQLPVLEKRHLQPANVWTCLLNRNYVRQELREITFQVAESMNSKYPGVIVNYLDANFPFIDNFPLLPHLSHNDGKKLDLSFQYNDSKTGNFTNDVPSFIGYGICEDPKVGEENKPRFCDEKGYWQYNLLKDIVWQGNKDKFVFDNPRTRDLVSSFASHDGTGKIFIEPHLKTRLGLTSNKIRFHGCQAVRHDDHLHVQLK